MEKIAIFGCGNILFGDDGAGPAVIKALEKEELPEYLHLEDAGTGIREILFDYLLEPAIRPALIIIVDSVDFPGAKPGQIFDLRPFDIPRKKLHDFSLHQFPTVNMLAELEEATDTKVRIMAIQAENIPNEVMPGLSRPVAKAVKRLTEKILDAICPKRSKTHSPSWPRNLVSLETLHEAG